MTLRRRLGARRNDSPAHRKRCGDGAKKAPITHFKIMRSGAPFFKVEMRAEGELSRAANPAAHSKKALRGDPQRCALSTIDRD